MDASIDTILIALGLTLLAGMATSAGALMAFLCKHTNTRFLSCALGISAGVMIYVSFMDLMPQAISEISTTMPGKSGMVAIIVSFFSGIGIIALIDWLIPEKENPHEMHMVEEMSPAVTSQQGTAHMHRTGFMVGIAIAIHNSPEGVATFVAALDGLDVAIPIVVAIAIHNIPEGIAVAVPIYHSTGNRGKALKWSILSGLAEPAGALLAMLVLMHFWNPSISAIVLAAVAGIMVYISIDELLPSAEEYGHHHFAIAGFVGGMLVMAVSLLMF